MDVSIPLTKDEFLNGLLNVPSNPKSLIIFVHGSGSSGASSPRNMFVASILNDSGFATLLVDLLTTKEQESDIKTQKIMGKFPGIVLNKFNIHLLSNRLTTITKWITETNNNKSVLVEFNFKDLPIGYFGSSTGAAAAIEAAGSMSNPLSNKVYAIVSRGGRPDLAGADSLNNIKAATLFIVGEKDDKHIISLNKKAFKHLKNVERKDFILISNAGHLFDEEEGLIHKVADISKEWFTKNLS